MFILNKLIVNFSAIYIAQLLLTFGHFGFLSGFVSKLFLYTFYIFILHILHIHIIYILYIKYIHISCLALRLGYKVLIFRMKKGDRNLNKDAGGYQ